MTDTLMSQRLGRVRQIADNNLERMDKVLPPRGDAQPLYRYLPNAIARAQQDPEFGAQLVESLQKYALLHQAFWGKRK